MQKIKGEQIDDNTISENNLNFPVNSYFALQGVPPLDYVHNFNAFDNGVITINHGMQKRPSIRIEDSAGTLWIPKDIHYPNLNTAIVYFDHYFGGTAYCS